MLSKVNENHSGEVSLFLQTKPLLLNKTNTDVCSSSASCGKVVGRATKLWSRCFMCENGLPERVVTSTRSTRNWGESQRWSGYIQYSVSWFILHVKMLHCVISISPPMCFPSCRIFSHPNVLPVLGACQSPPAPHPVIITHWMPYGSLYNVLHEGTSE